MHGWQACVHDKPQMQGVEKGFSWWVLLASLAHSLRNRFTPHAMRWINYASGTLIMAFGVWMVVQALLISD